MTDKRTQAHAAESNMSKPPEEWTTGDEPMTGAQRSYLKTLCEEANTPFDDQLTKAQASKRIDELQAKTGRGKAPKSGRAEEGLAGRAVAGNPGSIGAAPGAAGGVMPGSTGGTPGAGGGKVGSTPGGTPGG